MYAAIFSMLISSVLNKQSEPIPNPLLGLALVNIVRSSPLKYGKYLLKTYGQVPELENAVLSSLKKLKGLKPLNSLTLAKVPDVLAQDVPKNFSKLVLKIKENQDPSKPLEILHNGSSRNVVPHWTGAQQLRNDLLIMNMIKHNPKAVLSPNPKKDTELVFAAKKSHRKLLYRVFAVRGFQLKKDVMEPTIFETTSARIDQPNYDNARRMTVEYYNNYTRALQQTSHRNLQVAVKADRKAARKAKRAAAKQAKAKKAAAKKAKKVAKEA
jgi:hypothetical protein